MKDLRRSIEANQHSFFIKNISTSFSLAHFFTYTEADSKFGFRQASEYNQFLQLNNELDHQSQPGKDILQEIHCTMRD